MKRAGEAGIALRAHAYDVRLLDMASYKKKEIKLFQSN